MTPFQPPLCTFLVLLGLSSVKKVASLAGTSLYTYWLHFISLSRFLGWLEHEIFNGNSPIWREDFNQTPEALTVPSPAGSSVTPSPSPAAGPASNSSRIGNH